MKRWVAEPGSRLASLRCQVHHLLDARWRYGSEDRHESYLWLHRQMKIPLRECHVGMFDETRCEQALAALKKGGDYNVLMAQAMGFEPAL